MFMPDSLSPPFALKIALVSACPLQSLSPDTEKRIPRSTGDVLAGALYKFASTKQIKEQVAVGLSGLVYMLLIEGHVWAPRGTIQYMMVTLECADTAIEILDSANLLSFVYTYQKYIYIKDASSPIVSLIVVVCVFTFLLPTLDLYQLTMTDFQAELMRGPLSTFHDILHIFLIDCPNIGIRIYLWTIHDYYTSIYFMRNVLYLIILMRRVIPDLADLIFMCRYIHKKPMISSPSIYMQEFQREYDLEEGEKEVNLTLKSIQLNVEAASQLQADLAADIKQASDVAVSRSAADDSGPTTSQSQ